MKVHEDPDWSLDTGTFGIWSNEYRLAIVLHAAKMLLMDEFEASRTARDNSAPVNLIGTMTIGFTWRSAAERTFEVLGTVEPLP